MSDKKQPMAKFDSELCCDFHTREGSVTVRVLQPTLQRPRHVASRLLKHAMREVKDGALDKP